MKIITLDSVDSTNSYLKSHTELWDGNFITLRAIEQTKGKGRFSRVWDSPSAGDLTFSTLYFTRVPFSSVPCVTLITGIALYRVLYRIMPEDLRSDLYIKWPNDIHYGGLKLSGILVEAIHKYDASGRCPVIIGIGLNTNRDFFPQELSTKATSMRLITGVQYDCEALMRVILHELQLLLQSFNGEIDEGLLNEWTSASDSPGKRVEYNEGLNRGRIVRPLKDGSIVILDDASGQEQVCLGEIVYINS